MLEPIPLTSDVIDYVEAVFGAANRRVTGRLDRMPTVHEEALDLALIDAIAEGHGPHLTPSGTIVDVDVHFVGGGRHWRRWEIADIGFIVNFRQGDRLLRTKVALLQSKRLYPRESEFVEDEGIDRPGGFGSLMRPSLPAATGPRLFRFDETCRYKALQVGDEQWHAIAQYEEKFGLPVHYMLYHPRDLPVAIAIPAVLPLTQSGGLPRVGVRVVSAKDLRSAVVSQPRNYAPSYADLAEVDGSLGNPLQAFVVEGILACREGYVVEEDDSNEGLMRVFNERSAPIAAALRIDIILPHDAD